MRNRSKDKNVLILSPRQINSGTTNDFPSFNIQVRERFFLKTDVYYFYDDILRYGISRVEEKIRRIITENGVSILFFDPNGINYELPIEFFKRIKDETGVKTVLWILDDEMIFDTFSKYYAQVFDAAVTCDYYATFAYRKLGVPSFYFFSNYSKHDFHPVEAKKDIDVSFVGDCTKAGRKEYLQFLNFNGIQVETFGKGSKNKFVKKEDLSEIYSRTKINLNFTQVDQYSVKAWFLENNQLVNLVRQNKGRPMEIAMTNSFCLSEYSSSLDRTFEIGKDIDTFYDKNHLLSQVRYYLDREDLRVEMARSAYDKAVSIYEADIFMPKLLGELSETLNNSKYPQRAVVIIKDTPFKMNHINQLSFMMWNQFFRLKFRAAWETFRNLFQYGIGVFMIAFWKGSKRIIARIYRDIIKKE